LAEAKIGEAIETFIAMPLIIIISLYLLACTIGPLVDLNNQTFKILFTLAGGVPTIISYSQIQIKKY